MCKIETLPRGESWKELIGQGPLEVWKAGDETDGWAVMTSRQYPFRLPITEHLPPSLQLEKGAGITYKLIATLKVRLKKGFMRKDKYETVIQDVKDIVLEKHEMHSLWPIYNATLYRNKRAYAPTDQLDVRVVVTAHTAKPAKLKSITVGVRQTLTLFHDQSASRPNDQKSMMLVSKNKNIRKKIQPGEYFLQDMTLVIPKSHTIMSVDTAKHIEVSHSLRVLVQVDKTTLTFDRVQMLISGFMSNVSAATIARIGPVPALDVVPDSNPHNARPDTTVFVPDEPALLPQVLASGTKGNAAPLAASPVAAASSVYMDEHVPFPTLGHNDADFLGTPTLRRMVPTPTSPSAPMGDCMPPNVVPLVHMRPGDVYPSDPLASPSHGSASPHAQGSTGAGHRRVISSSSFGGSPDSPTPARRPVSVFMEPPSNTSWPYRPSRTFATAEQEKVRLFEQAREEAAKFQAQMASGVTFPDAVEPDYDPAGGVPIHARAAEETVGTSSHTLDEPVSLSEKEQLRRYHEAQDAVAQHLRAQEASSHEQATVATPAPFLTRSEQRAMEEKSQLQSHYAQQSAEEPPAVPAPALTTLAPEVFDAPPASDPPPRPPKVPLS